MVGSGNDVLEDRQMAKIEVDDGRAGDEETYLLGIAEDCNRREGR